MTTTILESVHDAFDTGLRRFLARRLSDPAAVDGSDEDKLAAFQSVLEGLQARLATFILNARSATEAAR